MTSREDFKQAIASGNINEAFVVAMSNAPKLSITTRIVTSESQQQVDRGEFQADSYLRTHINLIEGKIENEIGERLTGDRYSEIQQFHVRQVTQGHQTIQHNLISLQKMFQLMSTFQQQQTEQHSSWVDIAADVSRESLSPQGKTPSTLEAVKTTTKTKIAAETEIENGKPQLSAFEEEDGVMNDLLSLADLNADIDRENSAVIDSEDRLDGDWGQCLEDEPEVFDLESLSIEETQKGDAANLEKD